MRNFSEILTLVAVIVGVGAPCAVIALVWDRPPFWRIKPTPRRQLQIDRELIRIKHLRERHPDIWPDPIPDVTMKAVAPARPEPAEPKGQP